MNLRTLERAARDAAYFCGCDDVYISYTNTEAEYVDMQSWNSNRRIIFSYRLGVIYDGPEEISKSNLSRINEQIFRSA